MPEARFFALVGLAVVGTVYMVAPPSRFIDDEERSSKDSNGEWASYINHPQPPVGPHIGPKLTVMAAMGGAIEMPAVSFGVGAFGKKTDVGMLFDKGVRGVSLMLHDGVNPAKQTVAAMKAAIDSGKLTRDDFFVIVAPFCTQDVMEYINLAGLDRADMITLHQPCSTYDETLKKWRELEGVVDAGRAVSLGVCNFHDVKYLGELVLASKFAPLVNSIKVDASSWTHDLAEEHAKIGVTLMPYSPVKNVIDTPAVKEVAAKHAMTPAQVALRFLTMSSMPVLTYTENAAHVVENLASTGFDLTKEDMEKLNPESTGWGP